MKVLDPVAGLRHQEPDSTSAYTMRPKSSYLVTPQCSSTVPASSPYCSEGKVTASKRELRTTRRAGARGAGYCRYSMLARRKEVGALVVAIATAAKLFQDVGREAQLVHWAPAMALAGRALSA